MNETIYRETWAEINLPAIGHNIQQLRKRLAGNSKIMGVVKANAYGHGIIRVAEEVIRLGVDFLVVAMLDEAVLLRGNGIDVPILVLSRVEAQHAKRAADLNITLTVLQPEWLQEIKGEKFTKKLSIHIECDTGMGRTGIRTKEDLSAIIIEANKNKDIQLSGIYTHFATADEKESAYFNEQKERFGALLNHFTKLHQDEVVVHIGNSAAGMQYPEQMRHYTRLGVSMYGLYPSSDIEELKKVQLQPAFSLQSRLIQVKKMQAGEFISYGKAYKTEEDEWIGTIPIGYGDGWSRSLQGFHVLVDGKKMPIVGRVCMDLMIVKLDREYKVGTLVTLIGEQNGVEITVEDVAAYIDTINYEIPCMINERVPRVYRDL